MSDIKWIKILTDMFDDEKIKLIDGMPDNDAILIIWIKLLVQAGKSNEGGKLLLDKKIPYTDEMLGTIFNRPVNTVRLALKILRNFKMIDCSDDCVKIINWEKHQNVDKMKLIKEQTNIRVKRFREKQRVLERCNVTQSLHETQINAIEVDKELDKDKDLKRVLSEKFSDTSIEYKLSEKLFELMQKNNPKIKKPNLKTWCKDFDFILRIDKRSPGDIEKLIQWCQQDPFWMKNILSPAKLRKQFDRLWLQVKETQNTGNIQEGYQKALDQAMENIRNQKRKDGVL
jgi:predicted phage replisome organizer